MPRFDPDNSPLTSGFDPQGIKILGENGSGEPLVFYYSEFKGKKSAHIRTLYEKNGYWSPGKGFSVPADKAEAVFTAIGRLVKERVAA